MRRWRGVLMVAALSMVSCGDGDVVEQPSPSARPDIVTATTLDESTVATAPAPATTATTTSTGAIPTDTSPADPMGTIGACPPEWANSDVDLSAIEVLWLDDRLSGLLVAGPFAEIDVEGLPDAEWSADYRETVTYLTGIDEAVTGDEALALIEAEEDFEPVVLFDSTSLGIDVDRLGTPDDVVVIERAWLEDPGLAAHPDATLLIATHATSIDTHEAPRSWWQAIVDRTGRAHFLGRCSSRTTARFELHLEGIGLDPSDGGAYLIDQVSINVEDR